MSITRRFRDAAKQDAAERMPVVLRTHILDVVRTEK